MKGLFPKILTYTTYTLSTLLGLSALFYPFLRPALMQQTSETMARSGETPLMLSLLLTLCLLALIFEVQGQATNNRLIALLGVLVAINSVLRFIEVSIPGPGGFSPIFFLIILTGYVFGGGLGFLMGALTLLVSALITGGVGPWLPGQMFSAGWVGMSAPLLRPVIRSLRLQNRTGEIWLLALFGVTWGIIYGVIMNLWSWPFILGPSDQYWSPGTGILDTVRRYASFYILTSLIWDLAASAGNALLILGFGAPTLRVLCRFHDRFTFQYRPNPNGITEPHTPEIQGDI